MTEADETARAPDATPPTSGGIFAEVGVVYAIMFALVLALALGALAVPLIAGNLYVLVAAVFLGVPWLVMDRRGLSPEAPNLTRRDHLKGLGWGFLFTIGTLIPFAIGNHIWETQARHRQVTPDMDKLWQWPTSADGEPRGWGKTPGVWVWTARQEVHIGARAAVGPMPRVLLEADTPFLPARSYSGLKVQALGADGQPLKGAHAPHTRWALTPIVHARPVRAVLRPGEDQRQPRALTVRVEAPRGAKPLPLMLGPDARPLDASHTTLERSLWWLLAWWITQLFFIAWPEEYAYRGYLQGRLATAFGLRRRERDADLSKAPAEERSVLGITPSIVVTSALFGIGHLLIPVQGVLLASRASVFFPSLLFGWLRLRSGTLAASTLYHASCNMMVIIISTQYA